MAAIEDELVEDRIKQDLDELNEAELESILTSEEKRYMLYVERGDVASVKHILKKGGKENQRKENSFNMNCVDPLGRTALVIAVENENLEMINTLLAENIQPTDSLLHAIAEQYVEGVEVLLRHEETIHKGGDLYSWQRTEGVKAAFTADITPLILAAHKDNYEVLRLLLDRGAALPTPHDVKCACDECLVSSADDSLRHSLSRINAYRALSSPSLICLSSTDPLATAFTLSEELCKLAIMENEFSQEYKVLDEQVQNFATALIDNTRTSLELEIVLNFDPEGAAYQKGQHMHLTCLRQGVEKNQKMFVAHANVQQLLASVWYDGLPGFKRKGNMKQLLDVTQIACMFPVYCFAFLFAPESAYGKAMKQPIIKFIVDSASYCFFLLLLVIVSLRVETLVIEMFGTDWMIEQLRQQQKEARGALPSFVEFLVIIYIQGFIWGEMKSLWDSGLLEYIKDLWNIIDYITNFFYVNWILLRMTAWIQTHRELQAGLDPYYPRELWHPFDPLLISEGMFGAANIFSFLKLVHTFSVNPHLGPLQISLGRMVFDIIKFFFIYTLVLFAFGCGLNNLLWYYADMDKQLCYSLPGGLMNPNASMSCAVWRRFTNLFETSQSLFWASFGLVDLYNFELTGIKPFTRFWSLLMFGSYSMINVIVLLNLLIAMMSNSYSSIVERSDVEWKFARSKLWMEYFEEGGEVPPPFNMIPSVSVMCHKKDKHNSRKSFRRRQDELRDTQYQRTMRNLVRRYVTAEQRKVEESEITEDDVNEIKQDINSFKYELLNILKINGMQTGTAHHKDDTAVGRKQQARERRLLKGFNIGLVEGLDQATPAAKKEEEDPIKMLAVIFLKALKKEHHQDWNATVTNRPSDHIGSSSARLRRQSLRVNRRRKTAWNRIQFYQRRGVFFGGEINPTVLTEAKTRMKPELRSQAIGWRKLQRLTDMGRVTQTNVESKPQQDKVVNVELPAAETGATEAKTNSNFSKPEQDTVVNVELPVAETGAAETKKDLPGGAGGYDNPAFVPDNAEAEPKQEVAQTATGAKSTDEKIIEREKKIPISGKEVVQPRTASKKIPDATSDKSLYQKDTILVRKKSVESGGKSAENSDVVAIDQGEKSGSMAEAIPKPTESVKNPPETIPKPTDCKPRSPEKIVALPPVRKDVPKAQPASSLGAGWI